MKECPVCRCHKSRLIQKTGGYSIFRCLSCQLIYLDPLPSKERHLEFHSQDYFSWYYGCSIQEFYSSQSPIFKQENRIKNARLGYVGRFCNPGKLLDVGTGQGLFLVNARRQGWDVFGTDVSKYVCNFLSTHKQIRMFNGYLEDSNFSPEYFDAITIWHVLEHTYDPYLTLLKAKSLLKNNGHLFVAVPNTTNAEIYLHRLLHKPRFQEEGKEWHFYCFNLNSLKYLLKDKLGFIVDKVDCEFYLGNSLAERWYVYLLHFIFNKFKINLCKTILIHAIKRNLGNEN